MEATLGDSNTTWVLLRAGRVTGSGRIVPRLTFQIHARAPRERMRVQVHLMHAELTVAGERLGEAVLTGVEIYHADSSLELQVPIDRPGLDHINATAIGSRVDLTLQLTGWLRAQDENTDGRRFANSPEPGEWVFQAFGVARQVELGFQVARSDWFTQVVEPLGTLEYVSTEIALPRGDHPLRHAANQLLQAQRAYTEGDDPAVFSRCRAAIDALPGAPKEIFAGLPDPVERAALDALMLKAGSYLHHGRHVANEGEHTGDFPVDHADALFALNLTKLLIAQTARVLARGTR
jgi:hypothetical protein